MSNGGRVSRSWISAGSSLSSQLRLIPLISQLFPGLMSALLTPRLISSLSSQRDWKGDRYIYVYAKVGWAHYHNNTTITTVVYVPLAVQ